MNKSDLVRELAKQTDLSQDAAHTFLSALTRIILFRISKRETVELTGLGKFVPFIWKRNKITDYNTGATVVPPKTLCYRFRPSVRARRKLNRTRMMEQRRKNQ